MKRNVWEKDVKCWICIAIYKSNQVWTKAGADDDVAHVGINLANYDGCLFGSYGKKRKFRDHANQQNVLVYVSFFGGGDSFSKTDCV